MLNEILPQNTTLMQRGENTEIFKKFIYEDQIDRIY